MAGYQYEHLGFHCITLFNPSRTLWAPCRYELEDNALSRDHNHYRVSELMAQPVRASLGPDEPVTDYHCDWSAAESVSWHLASQLSPQFIRKQLQWRRRKTLRICSVTIKTDGLWILPQILRDSKTTVSTSQSKLLHPQTAILFVRSPFSVNNLEIKTRKQVVRNKDNGSPLSVAFNFEQLCGLLGRVGNIEIS